MIKRLAKYITAPITRNAEFFTFMYLLTMTAAACTVVVSMKQTLYDNAFAETFFLVYAACIVLALLPRMARRIVRGIIYAVAYPAAIIDVYCYVKFDAPVNPSILMLAAETDSREAAEFFSTYMSPDIIFSYVGFILLILLAHILWTLHRHFKRPLRLWQLEENAAVRCGKVRPVLACIVAALAGVCTCLSWHNVTNLTNLLSISNIGDVEHRLTQKDCPVQYNTLYRMAFSMRANQLAAQQIDVLHKMSNSVAVDSCSYTSPNIVLIIGEAYNKRHSQLYGYNKPTTPRQLEMQKRGSLVAYKDVVSPWNLTSYVFKHIMSTYTVGDKGDWCDYPLFGQIFRKSGYHVTFLTNEFLTQAKQAVYDFSGGFFINDPQLSEAQFDDRNTELHVFDEDLLRDYRRIDKDRKFQGDTLQKGNLTIFHLIGQHQNYRIRCPKSKMHFTIDDYADRTELTKREWRQNVCYYDNATLYNDSVVSEITKLFANQDAIIIYMPDHGEEVHPAEKPSLFGRLHSTAITARLAREEFEIPFWFHATPLYRRNHPEMWQQIKVSASRPMMTDALPHLLMYLAGIHCQYYREDLNILSPQYNAKRPRILKHQTDYDKIINQ